MLKKNREQLLAPLKIVDSIAALPAELVSLLVRYLNNARAARDKNIVDILERLLDLERVRHLDRNTAELHYAEHSVRPFFGQLVDFITSGPLVALVVEGPRAIEAFRVLAGSTDPIRASVGTIRGDHALEVQQNIVHGSDSPEAAEREIKIFFPDLV